LRNVAGLRWKPIALYMITNLQFTSLAEMNPSYSYFEENITNYVLGFIIDFDLVL
jgi:hypothetical protein